MTNQPMPCPPANTIHYPYVFLLSSVAALGGLLFGYDTAVIAGAIGYMTTYFELSAFWQGWAASCALIGCMIGAAGAGWISDRFGRKNALLVAAVLFTISAIGSALPRNLTEFIIYRILGGVGVGIASMLSPLYIAEVAPARMRGALVTLNQLTIVGGMLVVYFVNASIASLGDSTWNTTLGWRWMFGSETLPAVLFFLLLLLVPESPRWLIQKKRPEEARAILYAIGGESHARQEIQDIQAILSQERGSLSQLIQPGFRTALLIGIGLAVLQQITGINVILYYAPIIFESMGLTASTALNQTVIIGVINLLFTLFAFLLVDRFGRKVLLLFSSAGMGLSLSFLGFAFLYKQNPQGWDSIPMLGKGIAGFLGVLEGGIGLATPVDFLILLFILFYVASFAVGMGAVVWVVLAEIFPTQIRGRAMSIAVVVLWLSCFLVSQFFPMMLHYFQGTVFFIYALMCLIHILFVSILIPETKGKSLEEIERTWRGER